MTDQLAEDLRGFGPIGILAILAVFLTGNLIFGNMVALPIGAFIVLLWRWRSRTPWREIGYVRPHSWTLIIVCGLAFGIALKFLLKAIVMPLLGADPINQSYHFLAGNRVLLPGAIWTMTMAGPAEETVYRGFAFERLRRLFGPSVLARTSMVLLTSALFALSHYSGQGVAGMEQATITGLVFGTIFAITGALPLIMCAHSAYDLTALVMIYLDVEAQVAHLVF